MQVLLSGEYMGWTPCTPELAGMCVDLGYTAIGMDAQRIIVLMPEKENGNTPEASAFSEYAMPQSSIGEDLNENMNFFAYATITQDEQNRNQSNITQALWRYRHP